MQLLWRPKTTHRVFARILCCFVCIMQYRSASCLCFARTTCHAYLTRRSEAVWFASDFVFALLISSLHIQRFSAGFISVLQASNLVFAPWLLGAKVASLCSASNQLLSKFRALRTRFDSRFLRTSYGVYSIRTLIKWKKNVRLVVVQTILDWEEKLIKKSAEWIVSHIHTETHISLIQRNTELKLHFFIKRRGIFKRL